MKNKTTSVPIVEFFGLRSKVYSYQPANGKNGKTAKGTKRPLWRNPQRAAVGKKIIHKVKNIRSVNHELGSYESNKASLSCYDDKRHLLAYGISSYAHWDHTDMNSPTKLISLFHFNTFIIHTHAFLPLYEPRPSIRHSSPQFSSFHSTKIL